MGRFNYLQSAFLKGEVSPKMYGRMDLRDMNQACKQLVNATPYLQGGAGMRCGTQYVTNSISGSTIAANNRLIPFIFNEEEAYVIAVGTGAIPVGVIKLDGTAATIDVFYSYNGTTNYTASELPEIHYAQSGNAMVLTHQNHMPLLITRNALNVFTLSSWEQSLTWYNIANSLGHYSASNSSNTGLNIQNIPLNQNTDSATTMTLGGTSVGSQTITCNRNYFHSSHQWAFFRITNGVGSHAWGWISQVNSATSAGIYIFSSGADTSATSDFEEAAWSAFQGFPRTCCFFEDRLIFASTIVEPNGIWGSQVGNYFLFDTRLTPSGTAITTSDSTPFSYAIVGQRVSNVSWLVAGQTLAIGTEGQEYLAGESTSGLTALSPDFVAETYYGSAPIQAVKTQTAINFIERGALNLREFSFFFQEQNFRAENLSLQAEHMVNKSLALYPTAYTSQIKEMVYQPSTQTLWFVDTNGGLFSCTHDRELGVTAWHQHILGGALSTTPPVVISICVLPSLDGSFDDLYLLVERTVNSSTVYYIEKMGREFHGEFLSNASTSIADKPVYSDCASMVQVGSATGTFSGFSYLHGQTVACVANGSYVGTAVVNSSGDITLPNSLTATELIAGLPYTATIELLPVEAGAITGSAQSEMRRYDKVGIRFNNSVGANFGRDSSHLTPINFPPDPNNSSNPIPLFTGIMWLDMDSDYDREASLMITQSIPLPMQVTSVTLRGVTYE